VCGVVAGTHFAASSRDNPTFINVGAPYPRQPFTILIWGEDPRSSLRSPTPGTASGCARRGQITSFRGLGHVFATLGCSVPPVPGQWYTPEAVLTQTFTSGFPWSD
jgi:hypothetical protein